MLNIWARLAIVVVILSTLAGYTFWVYNRGVESEQIAAQKRSVEVLRQRKQTDDKTKSMSDSEFCNALGGNWVRDRGVCE